MQTPAEILSQLAHCNYTEGYRFNALSKAARVVYTDGVKRMMELCEAYWLFDLILSYQYKAKNNPMLREFQVWELKVADRSAVVTCKDGNYDKPIFKQEIEFTDFPLSEMKVYLEQGWSSFGDNNPGEVLVAMLPSER